MSVEIGPKACISVTRGQTWQDHSSCLKRTQLVDSSEVPTSLHQSVGLQPQYDKCLRLHSEVIKNIHLACSEAFDVQHKNSEWVFETCWQCALIRAVFSRHCSSRKGRLPISTSSMNIGMGEYPFVVVGSVSVCHCNSNKQNYSRPRLRESTYHLFFFLLFEDN